MELVNQSRLSGIGPDTGRAILQKNTAWFIKFRMIMLLFLPANFIIDSPVIFHLQIIAHKMQQFIAKWLKKRDNTKC